MKILLIGMNFGNYETKIIKEMKLQGHEVFYMSDAAPHDSFYKRVLGNFCINQRIDKYQKKMLEIMGKGFDQIIVIVGRQLKTFFLEELRKKNPHAIFSLYLWDDVKRVENFKKVKQYYDNIYSFDLKDCKDYKFKHLPLFFTQKPFNIYSKEYDIYSAMFSHTGREDIIKDIDAQAKKMGLSTLFYISLGRFAYLKRILEITRNPNKCIQYIAKPISETKNYVNMEKAKTVLDVQFKGQYGLTMRTIECIGMKNKLITTNPNVVYYGFYNKNNVFLIDRDQPCISMEFITLPYEEIAYEIYEKYSLSVWVKVLTGAIDIPNYIGLNSIDNLAFL